MKSIAQSEYVDVFIGTVIMNTLPYHQAEVDLISSGWSSSSLRFSSIIVIANCRMASEIDGEKMANRLIVNVIQ